MVELSDRLTVTSTSSKAMNESHDRRLKCCGCTCRGFMFLEELTLRSSSYDRRCKCLKMEVAVLLSLVPATSGW